MEEPPITPGIGREGTIGVGNRLFGKEQGKHGTHLVHLHRHPCRTGLLPQTHAYRRRFGFQALPGIFGNQRLQLGNSRRHGHGIARKCARLVYLAQGTDEIHGIASARIGTHRHAPANDLAKGHQVGLDAKTSHGAMTPHPETGHHLIENQQSTISVAQRTQSFQKAWRRRYNAHVSGNGFKDHTGDFRTELGKQGFDFVDSIIRCDQGILCHSRGHT